MSDKEPDDIPEENLPVDDSDIEDLDQTEKAAFEKIMAEIVETDDNPSDAAAEPAEQESSSAEKPSPEPSASADADPSSDNDTEADDGSSPETSETNEDDLSKDQQAALDKILDEINSNDDTETSAAAPDDESNDEQEQPVPLDQVMSEIDSEDADKDTDADNSEDNDKDAADNDNDDALTKDQQAALDQILSEIGGEDQTDDTAAAADASDADSMGDGEKDDTAADAKSPPEDNSQQADSKDGLSMEEFDDELSSLLTNKDENDTTGSANADQTPQEKSPPSSDQSLEDINSALKNIVNESAEEDTDKDDTTGNESDDSQDKPPLTVLEEIKDDPPPRASKSKSKSKLKKPLLWVGSACAVLITAAATYLGYHYYSKPLEANPPNASVPESTVPANQPEPHRQNSIIGKPVPAATVPPVAAPLKLQPFENLKDDIYATRQYLQLKKEELLDLKQYYKKGIQEEQDKLRSKHPGKLPPFNKAIKDRQIELSLRSIQRRAIYNIKLEAPLNQVEDYLEQLLYLERRTRLFELLDDSISGLSTTALKTQGKALIKQINNGSKQLSVEKVSATPPTLQSLWQGLSSPPALKRGISSTNSRLNPVDQQIIKSICKGDYERKYLLTTLSPQAAECLAKWPGKDLYLNSLTFLSPEMAKQLSQWQGEWLSLNSIKTLSAETARHLSQWPGKRLSLNGVSRLSDEATAYLAQWQGDQLEMVGLTSIGRWENYVTRLFLSESLKRKLEVQ